MQEKLTPPNFKVPLAATRIYDRSPEWKFHTSIALAKSAISYGEHTIRHDWVDSNGSERKYATWARYGELWIYENGEWKLEFHSDRMNPVFVHELPWKKKNG